MRISATDPHEDALQVDSCYIYDSAGHIHLCPPWTDHTPTTQRSGSMNDNALLTCRMVPFDYQMSDTEGLGAKLVLKYYLGASFGDIGDGPDGIIVRATDAEVDVLKPIAGWRCIWPDAGSKATRNYSFWEAIAPAGYVTHATVLVNSTSAYPEQPPSDMTEDIRAIRKDLVKTLEQIPGAVYCSWTNGDSGAKADTSAWMMYVKSASEGIQTWAIKAMNSHSAPAADRVWVLDRTKVKMDSQ
ncbi:hypothetical protein B0H16DRAFT_1738863 [Mycena metata]|uniref:Uncharacterized protein n=1 Tax=Mycena metata TaxID=1033252 RepID=A0AAD7HI89_9AGAR|nr:hypothetical protein B0H16DRAFT_1738863 [Mycena metata]